METSTPVLFLLGASHRTASLAVREKLSLDETRAAALAAKLRALPGVKECVINSAVIEKGLEPLLIYHQEVKSA